MVHQIYVTLSGSVKFGRRRRNLWSGTLEFSHLVFPSHRVYTVLLAEVRQVCYCVAGSHSPAAPRAWSCSWGAHGKFCATGSTGSARGGPPQHRQNRPSRGPRSAQDRGSSERDPHVWRSMNRGLISHTQAIRTLIRSPMHRGCRAGALRQRSRSQSETAQNSGHLSFPTVWTGQVNSLSERVLAIERCLRVSNARGSSWFCERTTCRATVRLGGVTPKRSKVPGSRE
jgi:hypothetical protein